MPNSILRASKLCSLVLLSIVLLSAVEAKAPLKPKAKTPAVNKPATLKPLSGAQMDTYVPTPTPTRSPNNASDFSVSPTKSRMLEGSLEHSEALPAEDSRFSAGATFDAGAIPKRTAGNNWYWLPPWFAGVYETEKIVGVYRYDFKTGKTDVSRRTSVNRRNEKWGWQQDRLGGTWQYDSSPYSIESDRGVQREVQLIKKRIPVKITQDSAVLKFLSTAIIMNRSTGKIEWTFQSELLQTYRPIGPNRIELTVSAKVFDEEGRPMYLDKNIQYLDRVSGFEAENSYNGKDMKALFREFLLSNNRADLVPDNRSGF